VPFSGTLVAFTDPEGTSLTYGLSGLPDGLTVGMPGRIISGTPTKDGEFTVIYQATDAEGTSNSISFVLTVNPASTTTVTGSFEGYLDKVECGTIRGWVWDRNKPNTPVTVEFYTGSTVWGSVVANIYRDDLKTAGKGNGAHAYSFEVPTSVERQYASVDLWPRAGQYLRLEGFGQTADVSFTRSAFGGDFGRLAGDGVGQSGFGSAGG
jgi:hypothetical protein